MNRLYLIAYFVFIVVVTSLIYRITYIDRVISSKADRYYYHERFAQALRYYEMIRKHDETSKTDERLIRCYLMTDKKEDAKRVLASFLLKEHDKKELLRVAVYFEGKGMFDISESIYRVILKKDPESKNIRIFLARVQSWQGKYQEAVKNYKIVLKED